MKRILLLLMATFFGITLGAQTRKQLWETVRTAQEKDLPQTALQALHKLQQMAADEKNDAELLHCLLLELHAQREISPDSLETACQKLRAVAQERLDDAQTPDALRELWRTASARALGDEQAALTSLSALAGADAKPFAELFDVGADSQTTFGGDLLSVLWLGVHENSRLPALDRWQLAQKVAQTYDASQRTASAFAVRLEALDLLDDMLYTTAWDSLQTPCPELYAATAATSMDVCGSLKADLTDFRPFDRVLLAAYDDLFRRYAIPEARLRLLLLMEDVANAVQQNLPDEEVERRNVCAALRRGLLTLAGALDAPKAWKKVVAARQASLGAMRVHLDAVPSAAYPTDTLAFSIYAENPGKTSLLLRRLDVAGGTWHQLDDRKRQLKGFASTTVGTYDISFPQKEEGDAVKVDFSLILPDRVGIYALTLQTNLGESQTEFIAVSRCALLQFGGGDGTLQLVAVDARSGNLLADYQVVERSEGKKASHVTAVKKAGILAYKPEYADRYDTKIRCTAAGDDYAVPQGIGRLSDYRYTPERKKLMVDIFTDRAIYRPSHAVQVGGVVHEAVGDADSVCPGQEVVVVLLDRNRKEVARDTLCTDRFGTFRTQFTLPAHGLTGAWQLRASVGQKTAFSSILVEEYVRPTFEITLEKLTEKVAVGDSLRIPLTATTFNGVPVADGQVQWTLERCQGRWWWGSFEEIAHGEGMTDEAGRHEAEVFLTQPVAKGKDARAGAVYRYTVRVTAPDGETHESSRLINATATVGQIRVNVADVICREDKVALSARVENTEGETLPLDVRIRIENADCGISREVWVNASPSQPEAEAIQSAADGIQCAADGIQAAADAGQKTAEGDGSVADAIYIYARDIWPSGRYVLTFSAEGCDDVVRETVVFSLDDRRVPDRQAPLWCIERPAEADGSKLVLAGSPLEGATMFFLLFDADGHAVQKEALVLSDSLVRLPLAYKPEWGDGATALIALQSQGVCHSRRVEVPKPLPDRRLTLEWKTFRPVLLPGQAEEWSLCASMPDGTPVSANVVARMYDASLDAFATNRFSLSQMLVRSLSVADVSHFTPSRRHLRSAEDVPYASIPTPDWTRWNEALFLSPYIHYTSRRMYKVQALYAASCGAAPVMEEACDDLAMPTSAKSQSAANRMDAEATSETADGGFMDKSPEQSAPVALRSDFSETAFFFPALRTDADGNCRLTFTLPEALTRWHVDALAFTADLRQGSLAADVVAQKDFTIQLALPRFLRPGDEAQISATLRNLTANGICTQVRLEILDAATEQLRHQAVRDVAVGGKASLTETFDVPAAILDGADVLLVRIQAVAEAPTAAKDQASPSAVHTSDGEERLLPILPALEEVERSVPFSIFEKGRTEIALDSLYRDGESVAHESIEVQIVTNPMQFAAAALPTALPSHPVSATAWCTQFYITDLAAWLARTQPSLRKRIEALGEDGALPTAGRWREGALLEETPWLRHAEGERERAKALRELFDGTTIEARRQKALDALIRLQNSDGGWGWCPGMFSSAWISAEVCLNLVRSARMTSTEEPRCVQRAVQFLKAKAAEEVADLKKAKKRGIEHPEPSEAAYRYLNILALRGMELDADARYLLALARDARPLTIYGKAKVAETLALCGETARARELCESILEHTVATPEMGRYFDTRRAQMTLSSYRIPTQCAAISVLELTGTAPAQTLDEMRLWLMQCKRTQLWETSVSTADAVFCLLTAPQSRLVASLDAEDAATYTLLDRRLDVDKTAEGLAWGSVTRRFTQPFAEAVAAGADLKVVQRMYVEREGKWVEISAEESDAGGVCPKLGEKLRITYDIEAARDFDFVQLHASRAAAFEPCDALSGYRAQPSAGWDDEYGVWPVFLPFYRAVHDASTDFFFDRLPKGRHRVCEEVRCVRAGTYHTGLPRIQSAYAPEFSGLAADCQVPVAR